MADETTQCPVRQRSRSRDPEQRPQTSPATTSGTSGTSGSAGTSTSSTSGTSGSGRVLRLRRVATAAQEVLPPQPPEIVRSDSHQAALFVAASRGEPRAVLRAIRRGANPSEVALSSCVCGLGEDQCVCLGYAPLHCASQAGCATAVSVLLEAGADLAVRSGRVLFALKSEDEKVGLAAVDGLTPLHVAAACGHSEVVELLLLRRADPRQGAAEPSKTAFGLAAWAGQTEISELLREAARQEVAKRVTAMPARSRLTPGFTGISGISGISSAEAFLARQSPALLDNPRMEAIRARVRARQQSVEAAPVEEANALAKHL
ncbi:unnamed protein product [Polarella glacialis]|uniref:Uncharacterized protein n=1 Tax=Polarella glacialis TaxID=89957 RepID=A0A813IXR7_POLGL|nr:unnamed protein product [Polarella glacialis]CAE8658016.1 unnamed protein product [Polarella glacialis]CAE8661730.1 unnamed protein product [Polarella glacialis]